MSKLLPVSEFTITRQTDNDELREHRLPAADPGPLQDAVGTYSANSGRRNALHCCLEPPAVSGASPSFSHPTPAYFNIPDLQMRVFDDVWGFYAAFLPYVCPW